MKLRFIILSLLLSLQTFAADPIPGRWFEGDKGYQKALELQKTTNVPILVWATWNDCPHCNGVTAWLGKSKTRKELEGYIRVRVDEHAKGAEGKFATEHNFHGGYFYVLASGDEKPKETIWAWGEGSGRTIPANMAPTLAAKLAAVKK